MATYQVLQGPVEHDGTRYEQGATLELLAEEAALLLAQAILGEQIIEAKRPRKAETD